jgi:hypothetical protein
MELIVYSTYIFYSTYPLAFTVLEYSYHKNLSLINILINLHMGDILIYRESVEGDDYYPILSSKDVIYIIKILRKGRGKLMIF